jgi:hypothetical protein
VDTIPAIFLIGPDGKIIAKGLRGEAIKKAVAESSKPWGESVDGVQCRLRADKLVWKAGETPTFKADVRNHGTRELIICRTQQTCKLEFDGQFYEHHEIRARSSPFGPGKEYDDIQVSLYNGWRVPRTDAPLKLVPGKHTIRIMFLPEPKDRGKPIRVISNRVEIEIHPATQAGTTGAKLGSRWSVSPC